MKKSFSTCVSLAFLSMTRMLKPSTLVTSRQASICILPPSGQKATMSGNSEGKSLPMLNKHHVVQ
jgi:hypothetical protein